MASRRSVRLWYARAMSKVVPRRWYLVAVASFVVGAAIAVPSLLGLFDDIRDMPRVVVPGAHDVTLEAGDYVVYGETSSQVDGVAYVNNGFAVKCSLVGSDGAAVELRVPTAETQYSVGSHAGRSIYVFTSPAAGTYHFACEGSDPKAVLAIGHGIGGRLIAILIPLFIGMAGSGIAIFVVRRKRRRSLSARTPATPC